MIRALLVECVEREYGVEVEAIEELKRLYLYKSYKLRMKNGEMYNLKEFHRDADKEVLNTVFSLKSILEQAGIRMGNIRKTQRGALWISDGISIYVMYEYIAGNPALLSQAYDIGKALRTLHAGMSSVAGIGVSTARIVTEGLKSIQEEKESDFLDFVGNTTWKKIQNCLFEQNFRNVQLIHGDFHKGNVLWTEDGRIGVIDLDDVRMGCVEEDVATWVFSVMYQDGHIEYSNVPFIAQFIEGYYAVDYVTRERWYKLQKALHYYCAVHLAKHCANFKYIRRHKSTKRFLDALVVLINDEDIYNKMEKCMEGDMIR